MGLINGASYVCIAAVENVEGTVVNSRLKVVQVILHLHLDAVAVVVFAAFELLVPVLFAQPLKKWESTRVPRFDPQVENVVEVRTCSVHL